MRRHHSCPTNMTSLIVNAASSNERLLKLLIPIYYLHFSLCCTTMTKISLIPNSSTYFLALPVKNIFNIKRKLISKYCVWTARTFFEKWTPWNNCINGVSCIYGLIFKSQFTNMYERYASYVAKALGTSIFNSGPIGEQYFV